MIVIFLARSRQARTGSWRYTSLYPCVALFLQQVIGVFPFVLMALVNSWIALVGNHFDNLPEFRIAHHHTRQITYVHGCRVVVVVMHPVRHRKVRSFHAVYLGLLIHQAVELLQGFFYLLFKDWVHLLLFDISLVIGWHLVWHYSVYTILTCTYLIFYFVKIWI